MRTIETKSSIANFPDDDATKQAVFDKVIEFFRKHDCFSGESLMQSDNPIIEAPVLLSEIADDILNFQVAWKDE